MIDVICWKWKPPNGYRSKFGPETVNVLRHMIRRFLKLEHRFSCITDDARGIEPGIRVIPLWNDFAGLCNPNVRNGPSCYRRLKAFSAEAKGLIGERIFSIDLDCVIVNDITPLLDRPEDFVCWGDTAKNTHYNGGMWLLRAGTRTKVWDTFDPLQSPKITRNLRIIGSDQAWISYVLDGRDPKWGRNDGVYSFRNHIAPHRKETLPPGARAVLFHGHFDPWMPEIQEQYPWVKEFYR
jgi:hypothetical protein